MKKLIIAILIFLLLSAVPGVCKTIYVNVDNGGEADGTTYAKGYPAINTAALAAANDDTILIGPGVYSTTNDKYNDWNYRTGITIDAYDPNDKPIIDGTSQTATIVIYTGADVTIRNLIIRNFNNSNATIFSGQANSGNLLEDIDIINCNGTVTTTPIILFNTNSAGTLRRVHIYGNTAARDTILSLTGSEINLEYCIIDGNNGKINIGVLNGGTVTMNIKNSLIHGMLTPYNTAGSVVSTTNIVNSILHARFNNVAADHAIQVNNANYTINLTNSAAIGGGKRDNVNAISSVGSVNITNEMLDSPKFTEAGAQFGIVALNFDCEGMLSTGGQSLLDIASILDEYGMGVTFGVNPANGSGNLTGVSTVLAYGHEIASHGWSHSILDNLTQQVFSMYYTGEGAVCAFEIAGGYLTTTVDGGQDLHILLSDYTSPDGSNSMENLKILIDSDSDYTATWIGGDAGVGINKRARATSLADTSSGDIKGIGNLITLSTDADRLLDDEINDSVIWLSSNTGQTVRSITLAGNASTADLLTHIKAFDGTTPGETVKMARTTSAANDINFELSSFDPLDLYSLPGSAGGTIKDYTEFQLKHAIRDTGLSAVTYGRLYILYYHIGEWAANTTGLTGAEETQLRTALTALQNTGVLVMSMGDAYDYVVAGGWAWNDPNWEKTQDYDILATLQPLSPAINAGTTAETIGLSSTQVDGFGNTYFFAPYDRLNIGADQNYSDASLRPTGKGNILSGQFSGAQ